MYRASRHTLYTLSAVLLGCDDSRLDIKILSRLRRQSQKPNVLQQLGVALGFRETFDYPSIILEHLSGVTDVYLMYNKPLNVYEFRHPSIKRAVFVSLCRRIPSFVLQQCNLQDLEFVDMHEESSDDVVASASRDKVHELMIIHERIRMEIFSKPETVISLKAMKDKDFVEGVFTYFVKKELLRTILKWKTADPLDLSVSSQQEHPVASAAHRHSLIYFSYNNAVFISKLFEHDIEKFHSRSWLKDEIELTLRRASMSGHLVVIEVLFARGAAAYMNFGASFRDDITRSYNVSANPVFRPVKANEFMEDLEFVRRIMTDSSPLLNRSLSEPQVDEKLQIQVTNLQEFKKWTKRRMESVMESACASGDVSVVKFLLSQSMAVPKKALAMTICAKDEGYPLFQYLLTICTWTDEQRAEALDLACHVGSLQHVQHLVRDGVPLLTDHLLSCVSADDSYDLVEFVHRSRTWTKKDTEDATCLASFHGNVEALRYFANYFEDNEDKEANRFSDRCLVLSALSPKSVPVFSVLCQGQADWSDKAVTDTMEIACAKLDMLLVECIVRNFQGHFGHRVLSIATRTSDDEESRMELLRFLMETYHWDEDQKTVALESAVEHLNIPATRLLIQQGARYTFRHSEILPPSHIRTPSLRSLYGKTK